MKTFRFYLGAKTYQINGQYLQTSASGQTLIYNAEGYVIAVVPIGTLVYDIASQKLD
jgi:hypothetical protein